MSAGANGSLGSALAAAQAEFPPIGRTRTVTVKTKTGGSYAFSYAPLEAIIEATRPALTKHGLAVSQPLTEHEGRPALESILLHSSGERLTAKFPLANVPASPQELGSLLTYLRRYAYTALLGIATEEDDDGNHASGNQSSRSARTSTHDDVQGDDGRAEQAGQETQRQPDGSPASADTITEKQLRLLWTTWRKVGAPDTVLRRLIEEHAGTDSTRRIPKDRFQAVLDAIEAEKQRLALVTDDLDAPF